ncbi:ubiquitin fusion degradation protein UFD1-domain-containing protein [Rhodocollybia butyracea]|uniref:Ubiquitin fusion degradation protein UFD1-domain-containing protein n=1 Tax=Rhodocollybia butyracea TaxID=206335 RepID=A0A9P5UDI1_9AGAR|nr:ubiquitin fusion degradation protein UFD1-domain-containing protein [Rhodocollybia butyracea]
MGRAPPRAFNEYLKAYSVAMMPGKERSNVSYGGKIIMPPSSLANLTAMDLESPWQFKLRNPSNPAAETHAGVLEFIAEEGVVYLPYWMMKTLRLNEGDPIRITGAELPKGQLVKLQAQSVHFLELSDHKAVLEKELRNFSTLTQGDIIEICYNTIVFGILVMETTPGGGGIDILDTDLSVDFAAPVGYVEPEKPKAAPIPTMADKLKIDLNSTSPGSSRPGSSLAGGFSGTSTGKNVVSKDGDAWESFKGKGETLGGRKTKGKGISHRKVEQVAEGSKIIRTDNRRIVSNATLEDGSKVPAALNLPFGQLFFGFNITPYVPPATEAASPTLDTPQGPVAFAGSGHSLNGRAAAASSSSSSGKGKAKASTDSPQSSVSWAGTGQTLGNSVPRDLGPVGAGGARIPRVPSRKTESRKGKQKEKKRSPSPDVDWGVDEDDDVIMIDSD